MPRKIGRTPSGKTRPTKEPPGFNHPDTIFKTKLLTLCLLKGYKNNKKFKLSARSTAVYFFGDIIFQTTDGSVLMGINYHDSDRSRLMSFRQLFHDRSYDSIHSCAVNFCNIDQLEFQIKNVRWVTNKPVSRGKMMETYLCSKEMDEMDVLYCAQKREYHTLTEQSREVWRKRKNISEEALSDFLAKFQLSSMSETLVDEEIRTVLKSLEIFESEVFDLNETVDYIIEKVRQWYVFVHYLEPLDNFQAAAILSTWKSIKYAETLKEYSIALKEIEVNLGSRILYIVNREYYDLTLIRLHREIVKRSGKLDTWIIINPNDSLSVQRLMIEAFVVPECRFLVVPLFSNSYKDLRINELLEQITDQEDKTVIFVSNKDNFSENIPNIQVINSRIYLNDLDDSCKNTFLDTNIDFQGKDITLKAALAPNFDANEIVDEELLLKLSLRDKIKIDAIHDRKHLDSLYITRVFVKNDKKFSESDICNLVTNEKTKKLILISDGAGMGKTTVLTKITSLLYISHPHYWIIRLELNRLSNVFRKLMQTKPESIELEDILNLTSQILQSNFEKNLFTIPNKVVLLIDGVDVVRSIYKKLVLKFLENSIARDNIAKVIVTTRPHLQFFLEGELNINSFTLQLFSKDDQIDYLTKYWKAKLDLSQRDVLRAKFFAKHLIEELKRSLGHASLDLIGIPLQTNMIAEVFQEGRGQWQGCQEFLKSETRDLELRSNINIAKLYEMFIERKRDIFVGDISGHIVVEDVMGKLYNESMKAHKKIALDSLLDSDKCEFFAVYRDTDLAESEQYLSDFGILQKTENMWIFIHQTFSEYFVSTCLWDELRMGNVDWHFLRFLLIDMLLSEEFPIVRMFFDNILINENVTQAIYEACSSMVSQISWNQSRNIVQLAKEGRLNILMLILEKCTDHKYLLQIEDISGLSAIHAAIEHQAILKYLVLKGADANKTNSLGQSVLHKAVENDNHDVVKFLIDNGVDIDCKMKNGKSPLHCAAEHNNSFIVELLIEAKADLNASEQSLKTPLHLAAENDSLEVVELLVNAGVDVSSKSSNSRTALDLAQLRKNSRVVTFLKNSQED